MKDKTIEQTREAIDARDAARVEAENACEAAYAVADAALLKRLKEIEDD